MSCCNESTVRETLFGPQFCAPAPRSPSLPSLFPRSFVLYHSQSQEMRTLLTQLPVHQRLTGDAGSPATKSVLHILSLLQLLIETTQENPLLVESKYVL